MKKRIITYISVFAFALLGVAGLSHAASLQLSASATVNLTAPAAAIGYSTHPPTSDPALTTYYNQLLATGSTWQRFDLWWATVQPNNSTEGNWSTFDTQLNEASAMGINTVLILDGTPQWAATTTSGCTNGITVSNTCAPKDTATVAAWCTKLATHFNGTNGSLINYFEFWNEQNDNGNWGPVALSSDYVKDLNACGAAIKVVNPNAKIISGGLSSDAAITGVTADQSVTDYMADGANFDMLGLHPYTFDVTVNDPTFGWAEANKTYPIRALLNGNGAYASKQIAVTEYGAPTCGGINHTIANQKLEADALIATSTGSDFASLNIWKMFWYTLVDADSSGTSDPENCFGILTTSGNAKLAYGSLQSTSTTNVAASFSAPGGTLDGYSVAISESPTPGANTTLINRFLNSGAKWMRFDVRWKIVQAVGSTTYDWTGYDQPITEIKAAGIHPLAILDYSPAWASKAPCVPDTGPYGNCAPDSAYYYINYCSAVANHFDGVHGPLLTTFEIWNEPNINFHWGPTADVAAYTAAMIGCSQAIKAVNPSAFIVVGAMSGGDVTGAFGAGIYSNGGGPYLDAISIHPYSAPLSLTNGSAEWRGVAILHSTMVANGDGAKPIWVTEVGAATCGTGKAFSMDGAGSFGSTDYMTLTAQSQYVTQLITALLTQTYIQHVFWYTLRDGNSNNPSTRENCFGSLFTSGNAKQAWTLFRSN